VILLKIKNPSLGKETRPKIKIFYYYITMVAKVKHTKKAKTMKSRKGKKMGKTMKSRKGKKMGKTMKRRNGKKKGKKKRGKKTMKGGFVSIIKEALVPLLFTASVVRRGKKKSNGKSRSRK
tara:strand:+ start:2286 stop:2648 length:363 start_codon:yes stop_codon:yes gene_type:complete